MEIDGISKSQMPEIAKRVDAVVADFRHRSLDDREYPIVCLYALTIKAREGGMVVNISAVIAQPDAGIVWDQDAAVSEHPAKRLPVAAQPLGMPPLTFSPSRLSERSSGPRSGPRTPLERRSEETCRCTNVGGILPSGTPSTASSAPFSANNTATETSADATWAFTSW